MAAPKRFSDELGAWLRQGSGKHTIASLTDVFGEKGFAIAFFILLAIPALPLPTGGVTHVTELIAMLLALELVAGRETIWLPKRWRDRPLPGGEKLIARLERILQWAERYTKPRMRGVIDTKNFRRVTGLVVLVFTIAAFIAPPFSGLDTLPALGVVGISLGLIFDDGVPYGLGVLLGVIGITLEILLGRAAFDVFLNLF